MTDREATPAPRRGHPPPVGSMRAGTLALLALLAAAASPVRPDERSPDRPSLVRRVLDELHRERFADALATAEELPRLFPDDPAGALGAANVYQTMMRDYRLDPDFVDPLLALALHDYWKSRRLGFGIGLHRGLRRPAVARMETVWQRGRPDNPVCLYQAR